MTTIRSVIQEMTNPSWIASLPSSLGAAAHGKLKADQWRTLGTLHLPAALIKLWGITNDREPRSERCRDILNITMSLISAVIIASSHSTSFTQADTYLEYMTTYLTGLKRLFPEYKFVANQHMAMHLHEYLRLFGPVRAWWTFPFERLIGMLQRIPTSGKVGM
jgi:hypothetical protein